MKNMSVFDSLVCPNCHSSLNHDDNELICQFCDMHYPIVNGIPDFRNEDEFWCNVSREKMQELNRLAKDSGDWLEAAKKTVSQYAGHFTPFDRADCQFLWPCTKDSRVLDAGSMWGGITIPAAQFHGEVYAVDKTIETLEFLKIRAEQMGFDNIHTIASGIQNLPFGDNFFDLVILSGVLEWVAFDEEIVLERHWRKFGRGLRPDKSRKYTENPRKIQLRVLGEIQRILKPGGCLYLAIENRIGYIYLVGYPDDHMNIPFICYMPRFVANTITKLILNCDYRTYVYTIPGYKSLLKQSGFGHIDFYGAFMHYIRPSEMVPLSLIKNLKGKIVATKIGINKILLSLFPKRTLRWLSPSIIAIAVKGSSRPNNEPRLIQLLRKSGLLNNDSSGDRIVKCNSRPGNDLTANYWVYGDNKDQPEFFCKVCRSIHATTALDAMAKNLKTVRNLLKGTELISNIPKLLHYGAIDNITFMVMEFIEARHSAFNFNSRLKTKLRYLDKEIKMAIRFLVSFQRHTVTREIDATSYLRSVLEDKINVLKACNLLTTDIEISVNRLRKEINELRGVTIPLCAQHGDYDFFYNILFSNNGVRIVDFEDFQRESLPFLDLATLLFNPILVSYEYKKNGFPLCILLNKYDLKSYIRDWFNLYAELSGIPKEFLHFVPPLAALEQRTKEYSHYRNPETFPINMAFKEFLTLRIMF